MANYNAFSTETFNKLYSTLSKNEQIWISKIRDNLEENPTGKILQFEWFREKKYLNKRLYFLIDESSKKILFVAFASKKEQQNVINFVKQNMKELLEYLKNL